MICRPVRAAVAAFAVAVLANNVQAEEPGRDHSGSRCFGVWTRKWADEIGAWPESVVRILNRAENAALKEAVLRHECPYGKKLPGEVTWPSPPTYLQGIANRLNFVQAVMVVWSFLPYAVSFYIVTLLVVVRGTRQLWVVLWLGLFASCNEVVAKTFWHRPRPGTLLEVNTYNGMLAGSCLESCGMPSTHAGVTSGLFVLVFLDATFRVRTAEKPGNAAAQTATVNDMVRREVKGACAFARRFCVLPWVHQDYLSVTEFIAYVMFWFIVLYPTSMARIVLYDHTPEQVLVGKFAGTVSAIIWWRVVRMVQHRLEPLLGETFCCGLLVHNFPLKGTEPFDGGFSSDEETVTSASGADHIDGVE